MKKTLSVLALALTMAFTANAGVGEKFKLNEQALDEQINKAEDINSTLVGSMSPALVNTTTAIAETQDRQGFLLRSFFCGAFALHRKYMGTGSRKTLFWHYFCIPIAGQVAVTVDFCGVLFNGSRLDMYKDNPKFFAWVKD